MEPTNHQQQAVKMQIPPENQVICKCGSKQFHKVFTTYRVPFIYRAMINGANTLDQTIIACLKCGEPQNLEQIAGEKKDGKTPEKK